MKVYTYRLEVTHAALPVGALLASYVVFDRA